jgi:hypothetical protein
MVFQYRISIGRTADTTSILSFISFLGLDSTYERQHAIRDYSSSETLFILYVLIEVLQSQMQQEK